MIPGTRPESSVPFDPEARKGYLFSVDDVGELVLFLGGPVTIGHVAYAGTDLALLGDIDGLHGTFRLAESFHGGAQWRLEVHPGRPAVMVDGRELGGGASRVLHDGDEVRFGEAAAFVLRRPDPSSATVILELLGRTEAFGARRVILMGPGGAGRLRIGPRKRRQLPVLGTDHDVCLTLLDQGLEIACSGGVKEALPGSPSFRAAPTSILVPLPITGRRDFQTGAAENRMPPFGLTVRPLDRGSTQVPSEA